MITVGTLSIVGLSLEMSLHIFRLFGGRCKHCTPFFTHSKDGRIKHISLNMKNILTFILTGAKEMEIITN